MIPLPKARFNLKVLSGSIEQQIPDTNKNCLWPHLASADKECLSVASPLLVCPGFGDQQSNAARAEALKSLGATRLEALDFGGKTWISYGNAEHLKSLFFDISVRSSTDVYRSV